ncbi:NADH:flavin oxidoreductase/NADH oxidase [Nocardiopsis coralliicola]
MFEPLTLRELTIPNRAWMSPMCMYSAAAEGPETGSPTDFHLGHLAARAAGGAGLVMVEATAVRPEGRISPADLGLWNDAQESAFRRITTAVSAHGAVPAIQLAHAGRKASAHVPWEDPSASVPLDQGGWTPVGPTGEPFGGFRAPHALTEEEIAGVVRAFADSARRALRAGFAVAEVHGAHGYLLHEFLSPAVNTRTDAYGGPFENRIRLALEVAAAVREVWPDSLPVLFRTSATDWLSENPADPRDGWTGADTVRLAKELRALGVDLLDVSTGGAVPDAAIAAEPGYQVPFAADVRAQTQLPTGAVGMITDADHAESIVASGAADAVFLGRELLRDPYWPHHAARHLGAERRWPHQYAYAVGSRG